MKHTFDYYIARFKQVLNSDEDLATKGINRKSFLLATNCGIDCVIYTKSEHLTWLAAN